MNLVTDPWLPVSNRDNRLCHISLNQLFKQPDDWLDLVLRPHERVSMMRFLLCILQAALGGGPSEDNWNDCLVEMPQQAIEYLQARHDKFYLFDDEKPFLQISDLKPFNKEPTPTTKLNFMLSTGNNTTLYDHAAINVRQDSSKRLLEASNLIISMLTFANFSLSGLYPQTKWKDKATSKSGVKDAPCASQSMLHCYVRKKTVIETLHANILTLEQIKDRYGEKVGVPVWDMFPSSPNDKKAIENAISTYIGRLVPLSRWMKILPDHETMFMGEGFVYPVYPDFTEAAAVEKVVQIDEEEEYKILGSKSATPWRELCAITTKRFTDKGNFGGPASIENQPKNEGYDLHILALKRGKSILDAFESVLHVPEYFSQSEISRAAYSEYVKKAESRAYKLDVSIQKYLSLLLPDMVEIVNKGIKNEKLNKKESEKYRAIKKRSKDKFLTHYWTLIEKQRHLLMQYIALLETEKDQERENAKKAWLKAIDFAAKETYEVLCKNDSPRQMRAYVLGWQVLTAQQNQKKEGA